MSKVFCVCFAVVKGHTTQKIKCRYGLIPQKLSFDQSVIPILNFQRSQAQTSHQDQSKQVFATLLNGLIPIPCFG